MYKNLKVRLRAAPIFDSPVEAFVDGEGLPKQHDPFRTFVVEVVVFYIKQ